MTADALEDPALMTRRFGVANPELVENPYYERMIRSRENAWAGSRRHDGAGVKLTHPLWCFDRFGSTITQLPFAREIHIGGEHEDFYDPDFCIYNDVVDMESGGCADVYLYPESVFPPTDFHSATRIGDHIYIIGGLRYLDMRRPGETWVYRLHIDEMTIERVSTEGDAPGWIFRHEANFDVRTGEIVTHGGEICVEPNVIEPNSGVHAFSPKTGRWRKLGSIGDFA